MKITDRHLQALRRASREAAQDAKLLDEVRVYLHGTLAGQQKVKIWKQEWEGQKTPRKITRSRK